jgi:hypothetical protein
MGKKRINIIHGVKSSNKGFDTVIFKLRVENLQKFENKNASKHFLCGFFVLVFLEVRKFIFQILNQQYTVALKNYHASNKTFA